MAAARKHLAPSEWSKIDQHVWAELFIMGDPFEDRGAASHWALATRKSSKVHYERWLTWLRQTNQLDPSLHSADRLTRDRVSAFGRHLMDKWLPVQSPVRSSD